MLYIFYGSDSGAVLAKSRAFVDTLRRKRPDAEVFTFESEDFTEPALMALVEGQGLFSSKHIVVLRKVFENAEARETVLRHAAVLAKSEHAFIVIEGILSQEERGMFQEAGGTVHAFEEKARAKEKFTTFALADALGACDKKKLWIQFQEAGRAGVRPEEIHGVLWFQAKAILLAHRTRSPQEAGMKPFPYEKAKRYAAHVSRAQAGAWMAELLELYHESRRGTFDLSDALEAWILK